MVGTHGGLPATAPIELGAAGRAARAAWAALALGGLATVGYFLLPTPAQQPAYLGLGFGCVLVTLVGIRLRRPARPAGWYLLAAANACFVGGDAVAWFQESLAGRAPLSPSVADGLYLAGYPVLIAAVHLLARAAGVAVTREYRIDAAVISVGVLAAGWQPLVEPSAGDPSLSLAGRLVTASYPVMDVGVLFIVVSVIIVARVATTAQRLLAVSIVALLVADVVYTQGSLAGTYVDGDPVDAGWLLAYVLCAVAALHPSMARLEPVLTWAGSTQPRRWTVVVSTTGFVPLAVLTVRAVREGHYTLAAPALFSIVAFTGIGVRALLLFGRVGTQSRELAAQARSLRSALATEQALEADLRHRAYHDDLTGLPNRAWLRDRLDAALDEAGADGVGICLADLDRFKEVNDVLGHRAGDEVLVAVARRLRRLAGDGVVIGRLGGDEFACVLPAADPAAEERVARWIVDAVREPLSVQGRRIQLSSSVGLVHGAGPADGAPLMARADLAMYAAKAAGRDRWLRYDREMGDRLAARRALTDAMPDALREGGFTVVYQPSFRFADGRLKGFEALVRWDHPTLGSVSPATFIPLAEENGFVLPLGRWVLETACRAAAGWPGDATVAVNVSARQLADPGLLTDVTAALAAVGLPAGRLVLEVTESAIMADVALAVDTLAALRAAGVTLAIDDFGTGHASLAHLRDLPVGILKIDRSFVLPLGDAAGRATAFVEAIVGLARSLGMATVAEGAETPEQYEILRRLGCDTVQGYLTGRPLGSAAAAELTARAVDAPGPHWGAEAVTTLLAVP